MLKQPVCLHRENRHTHHRPNRVIMRYSILLSAFLLSSLLAGCSSSEELANQPRTTVEIINNNFYDMNIFIVRSGQRIRLGNVRGNGSRVLTIPAYIADTGGSFRFLADPIGGNRGPISQEMYVNPGDEVRLTIPAQ